MFPKFLRPAFLDAGRLIVQQPTLRAIAARTPLSGAVLNAGCGEGMYCEWIASFPGVISIDNLDPSLPTWFHERHPDPRHRTRVGSLTAIPYDDACFDAIVCTEVLEHIVDDGRAVAELARVLKPGGHLIASVPLRPAPYDANHVRPDYSVEEFGALLAGAGLTVVTHRTCCHALLRSLMRYWYHPLIRVGGNRTPYIPEVVLQVMAHLDRVLRPGKPWDLVVGAVK